MYGKGVGCHGAYVRHLREQAGIHYAFSFAMCASMYGVSAGYHVVTHQACTIVTRVHAQVKGMHRERERECGCP